MKPGSSDGSSTAAPAPSPKKKIIGSFGSVSLCIMYAPIATTVFRDLFVAMRPAAVARQVGNDAHAQPTSNVPAFFAPSLCWTTTDVAGVMKSGESVPRRMRSTSSGVFPAASSAFRAARTARSDVAQSGGAYQRVFIPLPASILSTNSGAVALKRALRASFDTSISGTYEPVEAIRDERLTFRAPDRRRRRASPRAQTILRPTRARNTLGDVLGFAHPADGGLRDHPRDDLLGHRLDDVRRDEARRDRVHADAELPELAGPGLREGDDAGLRGRVVRLAEVAVEADDGRRVQDDAALLPDHMRGYGAGAEEGSLEVHGKDLVEVGFRHRRDGCPVLPLHELCVADDPRVVHEDVDAAEAREDFRDGLVDRRRVRDVHLPALGGRSAGRLEHGDERGGSGLVHVPRGHGVAALGEAEGRGAADAGRASGHDGDATAQNETLTPSWNSRDGSVAE